MYSSSIEKANKQHYKFKTSRFYEHGRSNLVDKSISWVNQIAEFEWFQSLGQVMKKSGLESGQNIYSFS